MNQPITLGIIGGMGPHAGVDLLVKLIQHTDAHVDADHLPVALLSYPSRIPERSRFLVGRSHPNPGEALACIVLQLEQIGADVIGIPCNTVHIPIIFDCLREQLDAARSRIQIVHMITETADFIQTYHPTLERVGILSTLAVYRTELYRTALTEVGIEPVVPEASFQDDVVNPTIFNPTYGLKARSNPPSPRVRRDLFRCIRHLHERGAEAVILACTEFPLAVPEKTVNGLPIIDPGVALARAMIKETYPEKLLPLEEATSDA